MSPLHLRRPPLLLRALFRRVAAGLLVIFSLALAACNEAAQREVELPIEGAGVAAPTWSEGEWTFSLERALVGFGPLYFCKTAAADYDLCPTALLEYRDSATIDALSEHTQALGQLRGLSRTLRSAIFDYAISWRLSAPRPLPTEGAVEGNSASLVLRARKPGREVVIRADLRIAPIVAGSFVVRGVRTNFTVDGPGDKLVVRVDPRAWWAEVGLVAFLESNAGDSLVLAEGTPPYNALVIGMTASAQPRFDWQKGPSSGP